jgi:hypothetical protein
MNRRLQEAFRFHLEWGGYSTPPGRAACALQAARAELRAKEEGLEFCWEYDENPDTSWLDQEGWEKEKQDYQEGRLEILGCWVEHPGIERYAVALWGISVYPDKAGQAYRRTIEADLASETFDLLDEKTAEEAGIHLDVTDELKAAEGD